MRNSITHLGEVAARLGFACMILVMIICANYGTADAAAIQTNSNCTADYCIPPMWTTEPVAGFTPGIEPLNVIISARSTVPLNSILATLSGWEQVPTGTAYPACLSGEKANVTGNPVIQQQSWRTEVLGTPCISGNLLSAIGLENHARLWNQPVAGSAFGAWFISTSDETACVHIGNDMEPLIYHPTYFQSRYSKLWWHCIDGSKNPDGTSSSLGSNGYDDGALSLVNGLRNAAKNKKWAFTLQQITQPAGVGEGRVPFSGTVYVVTVNYLASAYQGTGHNITYNITSNFALASVKEDQQGNISGNAIWTPPLYGSGPFTGKAYADGELIFTSIANDGSGFTDTFTGKINADGSINGNYIANDGQIGTWQVSPA